MWEQWAVFKTCSLKTETQNKDIETENTDTTDNGEILSNRDIMLDFRAIEKTSKIKIKMNRLLGNFVIRLEYCINMQR